MKKMSKKDASRIQSKIAKENDGTVPKNSFASRAQKAAELNEINKSKKV